MSTVYGPGWGGCSILAHRQYHIEISVQLVSLGRISGNVYDPAVGHSFVLYKHVVFVITHIVFTALVCIHSDNSLATSVDL
jgi:hypothetical protein